MFATAAMTSGTTYKFKISTGPRLDSLDSKVGEDPYRLQALVCQSRSASLRLPAARVVRTERGLQKRLQGALLHRDDKDPSPSGRKSLPRRCLL